MATNKVVIESQKQEQVGPAGSGESPIQVRILQVPAKSVPNAAVQSSHTAGSISKGGSLSATTKALPSGQPTSSVVTAPYTSTPSVMVVAKAGVNVNSQQVTKQGVNQVTTPGGTVVITVPRSAAPQPVMPPQLPANIQIPPGMMLIRSDSGQLMLVSQQALTMAQGSRGISGQAPRILVPQASTGTKTNEKVTVIKMAAPSSFQPTPVQKTAVVIGVPPKPAVVHTLSTVSQAGSHPRIQPVVTESKKKVPPTFSQETLESAKKCKNFLVTLIKLASSDTRSANMAGHVRGLIRSLLEGTMEAEEFTEKLYEELKSTPQPCLVPFLKKSLAAVRSLTADPQLFIQHASGSPCNPTITGKQCSTDTRPSLKTSQQGAVVTHGVRPALMTSDQSRNCTSKRSGPTSHPVIQSGKHFPATTTINRPFSHDPPSATFKTSSGSYKEDDDINDVASMAGVNLREENARILTTVVGSVVQSCQDQLFLSPHMMLSRIHHIGAALRVTEVSPDVVALVSHATQEFLRGLLEKLSLMAEHRKTALKQEDDWHAKVNDVRPQLRFLEEVEMLRKKRKDEKERERLLRLARSRSHTEDPQHQQLRQRAKELQQMEEAQLQQREANLTALAAIGPRRKRPLDQTASQVPVLPRQGVHQVTRVMLKDLLMCMEQAHFLRHSLTLYKAML